MLCNEEIDLLRILPACGLFDATKMFKYGTSRRTISDHTKNAQKLFAATGTFDF